RLHMAVLRLLHVLPTFERGGQQVRLASLIKALGPDYSHEVISLSDRCSGRSLLPDDVPFAVVQAVQSRFFHAGTVRKLRERLAETDINILCTYNWGSIEAVLANRLRAAIPHVHFEDGFTGAGADADLSRRRIYARRLLLNRAHVVTPSHALYQIAIRDWRLPDYRLHHIGNGVDTERFQAPSRSQNRSPIVIGTLGRLESEKNIARLLRVFRMARREGNIRLEIFGDGQEKQSLQRLAKNLAIEGDVGFRGLAEDPAQALKQIDIYALSSETEQLPMSLLEAMATGLPVVATNVGDVARSLPSANQQFVFDRSDEVGFAQGLIELASDPVLRAAIGRDNAKHVRATYPLQHMVDRYDDLFRSVLSAA
ncbi:MAG: glycosyltransferase family 4 protein, partial [Pseudomonadota bacterium]